MASRLETISVSNFSMPEEEAGPYMSVVQLDEVKHFQQLIRLTGLAITLLDPRTDAQKAEDAATNRTALKPVTMVVEKQQSSLNVITMESGDFLYRVNVHTYFTKASEKGGTVNKILHKDDSGSKVLIKGPYAKSIDRAILALEEDLSEKLRMNESTKLEGETLLEPLQNRVDGEVVEEPRLLIATWTAVNAGFEKE